MPNNPWKSFLGLTKGIYRRDEFPQRKIDYQTYLAASNGSVHIFPGTPTPTAFNNEVPNEVINEVPHEVNNEVIDEVVDEVATLKQQIAFLQAQNDQLKEQLNEQTTHQPTHQPTLSVLTREEKKRLKKKKYQRELKKRKQAAAATAEQAAVAAAERLYNLPENELITELEPEEVKQDRFHMTTETSPSGLGGYYRKYIFTNSEHYPRYEFISESLVKTIKGLVRSALLKNNNSQKVYIMGNVVMTKDNQEDTFKCGAKAVEMLNQDEVGETIDEQIDEMKEGVETILTKKSGWNIVRFESIEVNLAKTLHLGGSSYIPIPLKLKGKQAVINIENNDEFCFKYSVLCAINKPKSHPERVSAYKDRMNELNWKDMSFPATTKDINTFEKNNPDYAVNVFGFGGSASPLRISKLENRKMTLRLLLYEADVDGMTKLHYMPITSMSALVSSEYSHNGKVFVCDYCLRTSQSQTALNNHQKYCKATECITSIKMPEEGNVTKFKNYNNKFKQPFVCYADFECIVEKGSEKRKHKPIAYGIYVKNSTGVKENDFKLITKVNANSELLMDEFYEDLRDIKYKVGKVLKSYAQGGRKFNKMDLTAQDERNFQDADMCHICEKAFGNAEGQVKVRDHDHFKSKQNYRGAAHQDCNLNLNWNKYTIPMYFHNLRGYDGHLIIEALEKRKIAFTTKEGEEVTPKVSVIANNLEKFMSFSFGGFRFVDSCQHLSAALDSLASNLPKEKLTITQEHSGDYFDIATQKGVFPYEWFDSPDKLKETSLPAIEEFYSNLREEGITEAEYERAQNVWSTLKMKTFEEYLMFYLKTDVLLLADVFENYRDTMLNSHKLDPACYITSPGFSWDALLYKMSKGPIKQLEQLTDYDMVMFFERGTRGGMCVVSKRLAVANNKNLKNYDSSKPSKYISYVDANNLYGLAMSQYLPYADFKWNNTLFTADQLNSSPTLLTANPDVGYTLEVDLKCPDDFEKFNDFPMAPENNVVNFDMLSDFQKMGIEEGEREERERRRRRKGKVCALREDSRSRRCREQSCGKVGKLLATLAPKKNYVVHACNLKYYIEKGYQVEQVHRIVSYKQAPFMKSYIDMNTQLRTLAKSDFEKDLYKLLNNSVFGKTMENVRSRMDCEIIIDQKRALKVNSSPLFERSVIINENLVIAQKKKTSVMFDKPIYIGQAVLDLSKLHMYKFHYDVMQAKFGNNVTLCYTDTDSLVYEVATDDFYADMREDKEFLNHFDTSDFESTNPYNIPQQNKKVLGKFKDEMNGRMIEEFVGLRSKMYSFKYEMTQKEIDSYKHKHKAKGISNTYTKKHINHEDYKRCLLGETIVEAKFHKLSSKNHSIYSEEVSKKSLDRYDTKRYILEDGIATRAFR